MRFKKFVGVAFFCGTAIAIFADDQSKPVALSETPAAVQKTIQSQIGDGQLGDIDRETNAEEIIYDAFFEDVMLLPKLQYLFARVR